MRAANSSEYGLAHAVMSTDPARLRRVTGCLHSGVVWQNCSQPNYPSTPFGGCKQSGFGRELGAPGLEVSQWSEVDMGNARRRRRALPCSRIRVIRLAEGAPLKFCAKG